LSKILKLKNKIVKIKEKETSSVNSHNFVMSFIKQL